MALGQNMSQQYHKEDRDTRGTLTGTFAMAEERSPGSITQCGMKDSLATVNVQGTKALQGSTAASDDWDSFRGPLPSWHSSLSDDTLQCRLHAIKCSRNNRNRQGRR